LCFVRYCQAEDDMEATSSVPEVNSGHTKQEEEEG
jgi:hypothetical protein